MSSEINNRLTDDIDVDVTISSINSHRPVVYPKTVQPHPGCLVLGKDALKGNKYVTRYRIDHTEQRKDVESDTRYDACCPCTLSENRRTWGKFMLTILTSEPFILTLHVSVLVLGVLKEALNLREVAEDIHLVHSIVETCVACLVVLSRLTAAWSTYHSAKGHRKKTHHGHEGTNSTSTWTFTVICVILILSNIGATLFFYFFAHLGWTILSNNFVLLVVTVAFTLATERLRNHLNRDKEDQHKAVIYEIMLLSSDLRHAVDKELAVTSNRRSLHRKENNENQIIEVTEKIELFCRAVQDTHLFKCPDYISCPNEFQQSNFDIVTNMQMQSYV